ncbi:unnamed protein product, partial [Cylindrotheca closterium]
PVQTVLLVSNGLDGLESGLELGLTLVPIVEVTDHRKAIIYVTNMFGVDVDVESALENLHGLFHAEKEVHGITDLRTLIVGGIVNTAGA